MFRSWIHGLTFALAIATTMPAATPPHQAAQTSRPPGSAGHTLVYHEGLQAVVLVNAGLGSMTDPPATTPAQLWRWNGTDWSVIDRSGPPIRNLAGVSYDAGRDVIVMFGGSYNADLVYDETWEWSQKVGWSKRAAIGPGKRDHTAMAYDRARRKSVLFGGQVTTASFPTSTWTWDGTRWEEHSATTPGARIHHALVYDAPRQRILTVGGYDPHAKRDSGETWSWTGSGWAKTPATTEPRTHAALGTTEDAVVLAGGMGDGTVLYLSNNLWARAPDTGKPGPGVRYLTSMAYDARRKVTVLFGGGDPATDRLFDDTWELDATGWRKIR